MTDDIFTTKNHLTRGVQYNGILFSLVCLIQQTSDFFVNLGENLADPHQSAGRVTQSQMYLFALFIILRVRLC